MKITIRILLSLDDPFQMNLSFLEQWWTKTLLCTWSKVSCNRRSSLWWDGSCSQPCVSVSYGSLQPFGMFCASASGNSLHAFVGQHSAKHSRGTLFSIGTAPCSAPSHPSLWPSLPCPPNSCCVCPAQGATDSAWPPHPMSCPGNPPKARSPSVAGLASLFSFSDGSPDVLFCRLVFSGTRVNLFPMVVMV